MTGSKKAETSAKSSNSSKRNKNGIRYVTLEEFEKDMKEAAKDGNN